MRACDRSIPGEQPMEHRRVRLGAPSRIASVVLMAAALAALDDSSHVERTRKLNARGQRLFMREFRKLELLYVPSSANFILVRVGDGQTVFETMQKAGVIVRPMGGYQLPEWIRISIGTSKENQRCLNALHDAVTVALAIASAHELTFFIC